MRKKFTTHALKILMLTSSYPVAGAYSGTAIQNIAHTLIKNEMVKVGILIFSPSKKFSCYDDRYDVRVMKYPYSWFLPPLLHKSRGIIPSIRNNLLAILVLPFYFFSTFLFLYKYAKMYDIIHAHWLIPSGYISLMYGFFFKTPIVVTARGAEFHLPNTFLIRFILNLVIKGATCCTTVSNYMRSRARKYGLDVNRVIVITNAVDPSKFNNERPKKKKVIIGTVRRLVPEKRIEDLLKAFNNLPLNLKEKCEVWIIGDGPDKNRLEKIAEESKTAKFTKFFGMIPYDDIPELLSQIDICINPSIQEGMANINLESMAAGCCTIATNGYGNDEVIKDGENGLLYEPKNIIQLSLLLKRCIRNFPYHIGINAKKTIKKDFTIDKITDEYVKIYEKLLEKKHKLI